MQRERPDGLSVFPKPSGLESRPGVVGSYPDEVSAGLTASPCIVGYPSGACYDTGGASSGILHRGDRACGTSAFEDVMEYEIIDDDEKCTIRIKNWSETGSKHFF